MKHSAIFAVLLGLTACAQSQVEENLIVTGTNPVISGQYTADPTVRSSRERYICILPMTFRVW